MGQLKRKCKLLKTKYKYTSKMFHHEIALKDQKLSASVIQRNIL